MTEPSELRGDVISRKTAIEAVEILQHGWTTEVDEDQELFRHGRDALREVRAILANLPTPSVPEPPNHNDDFLFKHIDRLTADRDALALELAKLSSAPTGLTELFLENRIAEIDREWNDYLNAHPAQRLSSRDDIPCAVFRARIYELTAILESSSAPTPEME